MLHGLKGWSKGFSGCYMGVTWAFLGLYGLENHQQLRTRRRKRVLFLVKLPLTCFDLSDSEDEHVYPPARTDLRPPLIPAMPILPSLSGGFGSKKWLDGKIIQPGNPMRLGKPHIPKVRHNLGHDLVSSADLPLIHPSSYGLQSCITNDR